MKDYDKLQIGDQTPDGKVQIIDKDRLCYLVRQESRGSYGLRTISKRLLGEYIDYFQQYPTASSNEARDALCGQTDLDKFEYGYTATLMKMAKMVLEPASNLIHIGGKAMPFTLHKRFTKEIPLQQIYYGAPGTGKSYDIDRMTKVYSTIRTTFHPDSDYSTFVGAYKPTMTKSKVYGAQGPVLDGGKEVIENRITYTFIKQAFLKAYLAAWKKYAEGGEQVQPQFLVIEEINRGNCAQIFGDLFQLLDRSSNGFSTYPIEADADLQKEIAHAFSEEDEYKIEGDLDADGAVKGYTSNYGKSLSEDIKSGRVLLLPNNLYIWATMNTSDQSLFPIDSAFKRRWDWKYVRITNGYEREEDGTFKLDEQGERIPLNWQIEVDAETKFDWWEFVKAINIEIADITSSDDKKLGYFFCKPKGDSKTIDVETFVGKVIFYLWNDVFKDEEADIFKLGAESPTFDQFYAEDVKTGETKANAEMVKAFIQKVLDAHKSNNAETNNEQE